MPIVDIITGFVSFVLTLMILSYLIGDNPAFRVAVYIFVGASAGYAAAVAWWQVLFPRLILPMFTGNFAGIVASLVALVLGGLLLMKLSPRLAALGNPSIAFLVGVSAAVAVGGAVVGTILPQTQASINLFDLASGGTNVLGQLFFGTLMLIGTITTLVYFQFGAKSTPSGPQRGKPFRILGKIGEVFIAITLGVLFAGAFTAALTALIERMNFIWSYLTSFF
jgi:hypothetical protein